MNISERIATLSAEKRELLIRSLQAKSSSAPSHAITARRRTANEAPCSFPQQRLWFLAQMEPDSCAYNMPGALRVRGGLDVAVLQRTLDEVYRRQESLRTTFKEVDGQPVQVIGPVTSLPLRHIDLRHLPTEEREKEALHLAEVEAHTPFDLAKGPVIRATLIRLGPDDYMWLWTMHHIISDGWANGVLVTEVVKLYGAFLRGEPSPLPELAIQYTDFAIWQREHLQGAVLAKHIQYWTEHLGTGLTVLELPTDFPRPPSFTDRGAFHLHAFGPQVAESITKLCKQERVTLFAALLAAIQSVLYSMTGQDDIVVGTDVANRNRVETEHLIGFCINQLVMRTHLDGNPSFRELIARCWKVALGAYAHQDMPFDLLVKELNPPRIANRTPLFQVKLVLQNAPASPLQLSGVTIEDVLVDNHTSKFDIMFNMHEEPGNLKLGTTYNADLFKLDTVIRIVRHFEFTITTMLAEPDLRLDEYVRRLAEFEAKFQQAQQAEFRASMRQRLQLKGMKENRRGNAP